MSYNHILVAVDFEEDNQQVIDKAIHLAKPLQAKLSLIHVNQIVGELGFSGLMDLDLAGLSSYYDMNELSEKINQLAQRIDYKVTHKYVVNGDIKHSLEEPVRTAGIDLIVCGHHHDFWSRLIPTVGGLVNTSPVDLLVVALLDE
ncbi:MAG: universal stress protein [Psychromonas sp.]